jgi:flagellar biosynthesis protein FlhB
MKNLRRRLHAEKNLLILLGFISFMGSVLVHCIGHEQALQMIYPHLELSEKIEGSTALFNTDALVEFLKVVLKKITFFYL